MCAKVHLHSLIGRPNITRLEFILTRPSQYLECGNHVAACVEEPRPPVGDVVHAGEDEAGPAQVGLHEGELLPGHGGRHGREGGDAEDHGQGEGNNAWRREKGE